MFNTYYTQTIEKTLELLDKENCHIFAGGTDLMIRKRQWQGAERKFTQSVIYISDIKELKGIKEFEDRYEIKPLTTQNDIVNSSLPEYIKLPYSLMANPAIRNIATVGGNIVNAASVADSIPVLIALDSSLILESVEGRREVLLKDFIVSKYKTIRKSNELLTKIIIPKYDFKEFFYRKLGQRKASILSKVSVFILKGENDMRVSIGAINDLVIRDKNIEDNYIKEKNIEKLLESYKNLMNGEDDKRSTKEYKESVCLNLIESYLRGECNGL